MKALSVVPSSSSFSPISVAVVHDIPGRLRLRVDVSDPLIRALEAVTGVVSVRANSACRSIVVCYQGKEGVRTEILKAIARGERQPFLPPRPSPL